MQCLERKESLLWTDNSRDSVNAEATNILSKISSLTLHNPTEVLHTRKERKKAPLHKAEVQQYWASGSG